MKSLKSLLAKHTLSGHPQSTPSPTPDSPSRKAKDSAPPVPQVPVQAPPQAHIPHHQPQEPAQPSQQMPTTQAMSPQPSGNNSNANAGGAAKGKEQQAEALVRRDNEAKAKRAQAGYEGLPEGLTLGVKMGDGAFSNVFAATLRPNKSQLAVDPTLGETVKVAVKCVRKFELNSSQVSIPLILSSASIRL